MDSIAGALDAAKKQRTALLIAGTSLAWFFSMLPLTRCRFMTSEQIDLGLFSRPYNDENDEYLGCVRYSSSAEIDSGLKAGRAFAILALICTSVAWTIMTYVTVWSDKRLILWKVAHSSLVLAAIAQMLVFAALSSTQCNGGCSLAGVGILSVFNTLLLDLLCLAWFFVPVPSTIWISWSKAEAKRDDESTTIRPDNNLESARKPLSTEPSHDQPTEGEESIASGDTQGSHASPDFVSSIQDIPRFRLTTVGLVGIMWIVSLVGIKRCSFLELGFAGSSQSGLGIYSQAIYSETHFLGCVDYSSSLIAEFDGSFKTARAFGAMTALLTTALFILSLLQLVYQRFLPECWLALRVLLPTVTCTQLATLAALDSTLCKNDDGENECLIGGTGVIVLLNVFLAALMSILVLILPPPRFIVFAINTDGCADAELKESAEEQPTIPAETSIPVVRDQKRFDDAHREESVARDAQSPTRATNVQPPRRGDRQPKQMAANGATGASTQPKRDRRAVTEPKSPNAARTEQCPSTHVLDSTLDVTSIVVTVEYSSTEKKTVKVVTHTDGSKTVTTTIEEIGSDDDDDSYGADDESNLQGTR